MELQSAIPRQQNTLVMEAFPVSTSPFVDILPIVRRVLFTISSDITALRVSCQEAKKPQFWKDLYKDSLADIRQVEWKRFARRLGHHLSLLCATTLPFVGIIELATGNFYNTDGACLPDGTFDASDAPYNAWLPAGFFQITLGFGSLSFTAVKVIDIIWDIVRDKERRP